MPIKKTTANLNKIEERKTRIIEAKMKNPTLSGRELAKKVGEAHRTVARDLRFIAQDGTLKDNFTMNAIKDADLEIVTLGQAELLRRFKSQTEVSKIPMREVSATLKDSQVRYSFLAGENAKKDGGEAKQIHIDLAKNAIADFLNEDLTENKEE